MKGNTGKCCDKGECLIAEARGAQHRCYDKCAYAEEQNAAAEHENPNLRFKEYEEGAKHPAFLALEDEWKRCKHGQVYPCEDCVVEVSSSQPPSAAPAGVSAQDWKLFNELKGCMGDAPVPAGREVVSVPREPTEEEMNRVAFELAEQDGCDDPHQLIWQGNPPEPYGEVWCKYLPQARKVCAAMLLAAPQAAPASENGHHQELQTWYLHPECGGCWKVVYNDTGFFAECSKCKEHRLINPSFPDPLKATPEGQDELDADEIEHFAAALEAYYKSGNAVPVERAAIPAELVRHVSSILRRFAVLRSKGGRRE